MNRFKMNLYYFPLHLDRINIVRMSHVPRWKLVNDFTHSGSAIEFVSGVLAAFEMKIMDGKILCSPVSCSETTEWIIHELLGRKWTLASPCSPATLHKCLHSVYPCETNYHQRMRNSQSNKIVLYLRTRSLLFFISS